MCPGLALDFSKVRQNIAINRINFILKRQNIFVLKFGFSEKATKFEKNLRHTFDKSVVFCACNSILVKKIFLKQMWTSRIIQTLPGKSTRGGVGASDMMDIDLQVKK